MRLKSLKFGKALHTELLPYLKFPEDPEELEAISERIFHDLHGLELPEKFKHKKRDYERIEKFLMEILFNFAEVVESLDRIKMISVLISDFKPKPALRKRGVTPTSNLRYHYENLLNEIYLFQERVNQLLGDLEKKCKKNRKIKEAELIKKQRKYFNEMFESFRNIRGHHMHVRRFKNKKIDQLEGLELYSEMHHLRQIKYRELEKLKVEFAAQARQLLPQLRKILQLTLDPLSDAVFVELIKKFQS